eukprot:366901_1
MGKRKQKHSQHRKQKQKKNNSKNKSKPKQPNIQSLPSNILECMESKTQDPKYIPVSTITDKDEQINKNIRFRLSKYLKVPEALNSHIFSHLPPLQADLGVHSADDIAPLVSKLQEQFGIGSLVRYAASPKRFFQRNFQVPPKYSNLLLRVLHKDCIFRNVVFVPHNILKLMGVISQPYDMKRKYLYTVIIFDSPQNQVNFEYYEFYGFFREKKFKQFLKRDKWNSNTLRNKLPEFERLFHSQHIEKVIPVIGKHLHLGYNSLRSFASICLPANLTQCIENKKHKHLIQEILNDMYSKCELNETKYQCLCRSPLLKAMDTNKIFDFISSQFPFLLDAVNAIINVLGTEKWRELYRSTWLEDPSKATISKMWKLQKRIEGRNCSNCNKNQIRDKQDDEKFGKCSRCKSTWYCSKECQKYHWKKVHRLHCSENMTHLLDM